MRVVNELKSRCDKLAECIERCMVLYEKGCDRMRCERLCVERAGIDIDLCLHIYARILKGE